MKQAVILAAGAGVRLRSASNGTPKCLLNVGGRPLIDHQLRVLAGVGITQVCVVVGHAADRVRAAIGSFCRCIVNHRYAETNSLYSLWLAREEISHGFVLINGDVLAHPDVYHRVLAVEGNALAFDSTSGHDPEHMKVCIEDGLVRAISKDLAVPRCHGENVGILQFDPQSTVELFQQAKALVSAGGERTWAPAAVDRLARERPIRAIDVAGLPWTEIDFPEDLAHAEQVIWPSLCGGRWTGGNGTATHGARGHDAPETCGTSASPSP